MSIFNRAVGSESYDEQPNSNVVQIDEKTVELKGPLSNAYTQALQEVYKKDTDGNPESVAQESSPNITINQSNGETADTIVFAVTQDQITPDVITEVAADLATTDRPDEYILVIDGTDPSELGDQASDPKPVIVELGQALEKMAIRLGAEVYHSFDAWQAAKKAK